MDKADDFPKNDKKNINTITTSLNEKVIRYFNFESIFILRRFPLR